MPSIVVIRCPRTNHEVPTGFVRDLKSIATLSDRPYAIKCPACGERHCWSKNEAWLSLTLTVEATSLRSRKRGAGRILRTVMAGKATIA
jgi:hypothetical protein